MTSHSYLMPSGKASISGAGQHFFLCINGSPGAFDALSQGSRLPLEQAFPREDVEELPGSGVPVGTA